ncbi:transposase [Chryseobacterium daecheongense]|nr:transposase [Chryseobacterium daecheongense]WBV56398.1 transposase [Chryseobacterium daecheongense]
MRIDLKNIKVGYLISERIKECDIDITRICDFFSCEEPEIEKMCQMDSLESDTLLKWCKLLKYDFFRLYTQHLILYSPPASRDKHINTKSDILPTFRKNVYTKELISFVMEQLNNGVMDTEQIIEEYRIPKTTLFKWLSKYKNF